MPLWLPPSLGIGGNDAHTLALLHFDTSTALTTDVAVGQSNTWTNNNTATCGTGSPAPKFGPGSLALVKASSQYLATPHSSSWNFGSSDFTVEAWLYYLGGTQPQGLFAHLDASAAGWNTILGNVSTDKLTFATNGTATTLTSSTSLSANAWTHFAVACSGGVISMYFNGVKDANTLTSSVQAATGRFAVGGLGDYTGQPTFFWGGNIDEFRVSNNARYTASFTPPPKAFG